MPVITSPLAAFRARLDRPAVQNGGARVRIPAVNLAHQHLGWSKEDTLARLKEQFGAPKPADLSEYIEWAYALSQNGHEEEELEAG